MGGMNEQGLVVECLWLHQTLYPTADARPALTELQWIQHQLDNCRTVAEVMASDALVRILPSATKLHFLVCDRTGQAGVVEFLNGQSRLYDVARLPVKALTNATYEECLTGLKNFLAFGGQEPIPNSPGSIERFARMAAGLRSEVSVEAAFRLLDSVRYDGAESPTQWRIVYDPVGLEIVFETRDNPARRSIQAGAVDFDCGRAGQVLDLAQGAGGDIIPLLKAYSPEWNRERTRYIFDLYRKTNYAPDVPEIAVMLLGN
jgi:choloylglycine hydrolase